jgi:hypothetical protein
LIVVNDCVPDKTFVPKLKSVAGATGTTDGKVIVVNTGILRKASKRIVVTEFGKVIDVNIDPWKAALPMLVNVEANVKFASLVLINAEFPIEVYAVGGTTVSKFDAPLNVSFGIVVKVAGIFTYVMAVAPWNIFVPNVVIASDKIT